MGDTSSWWSSVMFALQLLDLDRPECYRIAFKLKAEIEAEGEPLPFFDRYECDVVHLRALAGIMFQFFLHVSQDSFGSQWCSHSEGFAHALHAEFFLLRVNRFFHAIGVEKHTIAGF
jgi:hypothetical protein